MQIHRDVLCHFRRHRGFSVAETARARQCPVNRQDVKNRWNWRQATCSAIQSKIPCIGLLLAFVGSHGIRVTLRDQGSRSSKSMSAAQTFCTTDTERLNLLKTFPSRGQLHNIYQYRVVSEVSGILDAPTFVSTHSGREAGRRLTA